MGATAEIEQEAEQSRTPTYVQCTVLVDSLRTGMYLRSSAQPIVTSPISSKLKNKKYSVETKRCVAWGVELVVVVLQQCNPYQ
jgi:hypothetical protein